MLDCERVWLCVCLCVVAVNHQRFISSVTTSQTLWRAIMLYQQINDLAITGHNWLWNKGYNILSVSLQLFNTPSCTLQLVLPENSTCPLFAPSSYFPLPPSMSLERTSGSFFPFIFSVRHLENRVCLCHSLSHSIIPMFIQLSALSNVPPPPFLPPPVPPAFLFTLTMSRLLTTAALITVLHLSISIYLPPIVFFPTILPLLDASSSWISSPPGNAFVQIDAVPFVSYEDKGCRGEPVHPFLSSCSVPP